MIAINPAGGERFFVSPNGTSLLGTKLHMKRRINEYSSHLSENGRRLNLIGVLLENRRELRRKFLNLVIETLSLAEANSIFLALELQLHHVVRIAKTPVTSQLISELSVSG